jgi:hypothetical protein
LLEAVERLEEFANQMLFPRLNESQGLLHKYRRFKIAIEKCIEDIDMAHFELELCSKSK